MKRNKLSQAKPLAHRRPRTIDARSGPFRMVLRTVLFTIIFITLGELSHAQDNAIYVATYVDVLPSEGGGATMLQRYRDASRNEDGNLRFDVLHEIARSDHFAILEVWRDKATFELHNSAVSSLHFRESFNSIRSAPYDERINKGIYVGPLTKTESQVGAIFVITHVDVMPEHQSDCLELLKVMQVDIARDYGNVTYEALQQADPANHFTVVEEWKNKKAFDAHAMAAHTRSFRERLSVMLGAPYDERLYTALN